MKCNECNNQATEPDPRDSKQSIQICTDCSLAIQYEFDAVMTGRSLEKEALCLQNLKKYGLL